MPHRPCPVLLLAFLVGCASRRAEPEPAVTETRDLEAFGGDEAFEDDALPEAADRFTRAWWSEIEPVRPEERDDFATQFDDLHLTLEIPSDWEVLMDVAVEEEGLPRLGGRLMHALPQDAAALGAYDVGVIVDVVPTPGGIEDPEALAELVAWWMARSGGGTWVDSVVDEAGPWTLEREIPWPEPHVLLSVHPETRPRAWVVAFSEPAYTYILSAFPDVRARQTRAVLASAGVMPIESWMVP